MRSKKKLEMLADAGDNESQYYLKHGSPRPNSFRDIPEHLLQYTEHRQCYKNALEACLEDDSLVYVEGVANPGPIPVKHAWVEKDDDIIELTWSSPGEHYFGVEIPRLVVLDTTRERDWIGPCIPPARKY